MQSAGSGWQTAATSILGSLGAQTIGETSPRTILYEEAAPALGLYFLEAGIVQLQTPEASGDPFILEVVMPGDVFGEESLSEIGIYGNTARVLVPSVLRWIPPPEFGDVAGQREAWSWIADRIVRRHWRALKRFNVMCRQDVVTRILSGLVDMSRWCPGRDGMESILPLSQAAFAQIICSTRETVSTKLNRLAEDRLVQLAPCQIGIPSVDRLREALSDAAEAGR